MGHADRYEGDAHTGTDTGAHTGSSHDAHRGTIVGKTHQRELQEGEAPFAPDGAKRPPKNERKKSKEGATRNGSDDEESESRSSSPSRKEIERAWLQGLNDIGLPQVGFSGADWNVAREFLHVVGERSPDVTYCAVARWDVFIGAVSEGSRLYDRAIPFLPDFRFIGDHLLVAVKFADSYQAKSIMPVGVRVPQEFADSPVDYLRDNLPLDMIYNDDGEDARFLMAGEIPLTEEIENLLDSALLQKRFVCRTAAREEECSAGVKFL